MFFISARNLNSLTVYCNLILLHLAEKCKDDVIQSTFLYFCPCIKCCKHE